MVFESLQRSPFEELNGAPRKAPRAAFLAGIVGTALVHGAGIALTCLAPAPQSTAQVRTAAPVSKMFEVDLEPPPAPPPAAPAQTPSGPKVTSRVNKAPTHARAPAAKAPPATAQAAQVLARLPSEPDTVDFGETFVQGSAAAYAGGVSDSAGTATRPVRSSDAHADGSDGTVSESADVDRSQPARLAHGVYWDDCPFPPEADAADIHNGQVTLRVKVAANGYVDEVSVVNESSLGFGRETGRCALQKRWQPGRDRTGAAMAGTHLVRVRFTR
jgi:outer membrane biosynthesis protein TonB